MTHSASTDKGVTAPAKPYRLGVVFVHGIGEQPPGDTLKNIVDPIVRSLDLWLHGAARCRAAVLGETAAAEWAKGMPELHAALGRGTLVREEAFEMSTAAVTDSRNHLLPGQAEALDTSAFWSGGALLCDGALQSSPVDGGPPTHAFLHLHTVDAHYQVTQGHALVAESWWARSFVPPSAQALLSWTFKVLPLALGMHFGDLVRRCTNRATQSQGFWKRLWHSLTVVVALVMMTLLVPLALPLQVVLTATVVLGALPVRFIQDAMRGVQSALIGTLGDSFLLVSSPVSRAMIVAQCKRDINWLAQRCEQVFVVGHSQGCAVSYLALRESRPDAVCDVTWIGSGLRKLEVLRTAEREGDAVMSGWLVATTPLVVAAMAHSLITHWSWDSAFSQSLVALAGLVGFVFGFAQLSFLLRAGSTDARLHLWRHDKVALTDVHASHDPVPHGPLYDGSAPGSPTLHSREVRNRASWLADHTSYWQNLEEVVLPLSLRLAAALGVPVDRLLTNDAEWLARSVRRRHHRVRTLVALRVLLAAGGVWLMWQVLSQPHAAGWSWGGAGIDRIWGWIDTGSASASQAFSASLRSSLAALIMGVTLPYLVMTLTWRSWEVHQQRAFLLRRHPGGFLEFIATGVMMGAALTPASIALSQLPSEGGAIFALVTNLLVSFFVGIFYVLSLRAHQRDFT